ncbi:MAG: hypothetical protein KDB90_04845 [Planctomycetes bacterium]|nr:hypothetical protein [Planctomycetota bacterium]
MLAKGSFLKDLDPLWVGFGMIGLVLVLIIAAVAAAVSMLRKDNKTTAGDP